MDYKTISTRQLEDLSRQAFAEYCALATRPRGDWRPGMTFPELEAATRRLNAIGDELERRIADRSNGR